MVQDRQHKVSHQPVKPGVLGVLSLSSVMKSTLEFIFLPIPAHLRYTPGEPIQFGLAKICLLSFCTIFLVANLAYCQPLLSKRPSELDTDTHRSWVCIHNCVHSYATGILLISPLGDLIRRRQMILLLILASASLTVGLAFTSSFLLFRILVFLTGLTTISTQIIIALARDHAPPSRSATVYSIILAGYLSGVLAARLIAGVIAQAVSWKFVFYFAFATQYAILNLTYTGILWTMFKYAATEPAVMQAELVSMALGVAVSNYSVTLTFLLGGPPYNYSTYKIGLFGLTDLTGIVLSPFAGRLVDLISPWTALLISSVGLFLFQTIQTAAGGSYFPALIVACIGIDAIRQLQYISLAAFMYRYVLTLTYYLGQLIGTSAGSKIFVEHGWRVSAAFGLAWYGAQIIVVLVRGPHCKRRTWVGY
ncbi:major facilitator superfamily domain-containing protein [Flammula alnicola]|nr:major facilitator superfamily domain-containing protein [Flammula alnicola]